MSARIQQESESTFIVTFNEAVDIHTTLTASGDEVQSWINEILQLDENVVGIDVEWRPSFSRIQNPTALLQLCIGDRCLIFQLLYADYIPDALRRFLSNARFTFVGVGILNDVERLTEDTSLRVYNTVDLRELAAERTGQFEMRQKGLQALALAIMGVQLYKPEHVRMSRWDQSTLTMQQIKYACLDAFVSFQIGRMLYDGHF